MNRKKTTNKKFGIIVSGGPAPGINSVISSAVIEALNLGYEVVGLKNGFRAVSLGEGNPFIPLGYDMVSRIANTGGSIIGISRFNPLSKPETKDRFLRALNEQNIDKLIVIGGEGSAYLSLNICREFPELQVVHVPKTIDNDLILPNEYPSFGFETARYAGTRIVNTLMVDAKTCERWFLVTSMGRKAGYLALGLGIAGGATLTLIPEEFQVHRPSADEVAGTIFSTIQTRIQAGKNYGVIILAEGILDRLDPESCTELQKAPRDDLGRIRYSQIELGDVLLPALRKRLTEAKLDVRINTKNIGYELRCHDPVSFDIEYTKLLGYGAVKHILEGYSGVMITRNFDHIGYIRLIDMVQTDGSIRSRMVDLSSDLYLAARRFMIR